MESLFAYIGKQYNHAVHELADPRVTSKPFMDSPWPVLAYFAAWFYFVTIGGRNFMKKRNPYNLQTTMVIYNACQSIANGFGFMRAVFGFYYYPYSKSCIGLRNGTDDFYTNEILNMGYFYTLLKFSDLADTVFMVLKKNYHQISFLHVYHHAYMGLGSWFFFRYVPGSQLVGFGIVNFLVHSIMYFYYLLSALDPKYKRAVAWKKKLTQLQMAQFVVTFIYFGIGLAPSCYQNKYMLWFFMFQTGLMFYLFAQFYYRTYIKQKHEKLESIHEKHDKIEANGKKTE